MIAGLPMYDRPETAAANDRLWHLIRNVLGARGIAAPMHLTRDIDPWQLWRRPDLVLAQTCGLPFRSALHGTVELVATPVYDLPCAPGHYYSVILGRRDDPRRTPAEFDGARLAVNDARSQSGWAAPVDWAARQRLRFGAVTLTGAHTASARAVAEGRADLAALDALSWKIAQRCDGFAGGLREIAHTAPTPALPYIAATGADAAGLFDGLSAALAALSAADRNTLGLQGVVQIPAQDYLSVATPPAPA